MIKHRFGTLTAASLIALAALGACSKSKSTGRVDGTFKANLFGEPPNLNPFSYTDLYAQNVFNYVLDQLMVYNSDTYEWQPNLAERFETSKDGKVFTFFLRKNAKFHDGVPVTAADVKFSFDAIFDDAYGAARQRTYYTGIAKVEVVDDHTVKFYTKDTYFGNLQQAALLWIVPKHVYGDPTKGPKITKTVVGSGPYSLEKLEQGKRLIVKRNDAWHGRSVDGLKEQFLFDRIQFRFVSSQDLAVQMLEKGDLDFDTLSGESYVERTKGPAWGKTVDKVKVQNDSPADGYSFLAWNLLRKPFDNRNVRIALAHLMNRELINQKFRYGMSDLATGPWYRRSPYADQSVKPIEFNPAKARELLTKEGWIDSNKDGLLDKVVDGVRRDFRFTMTISVGSKDALKYFTLYKEDLKKQGIDMVINQVEWNTFVKLISDEKNFDAATLAWGGGVLDTDPKQIWHSANTMPGGSNFISYKNPVVDKLIDKAIMIPEREKRIPLMQEIYRTIAADAPYIFLFNTRDIAYGVNKDVIRPKDTRKYSIGASFWSLKKAAGHEQLTEVK
ncbi:MAG TPA: ABC transporter substrate-binding protein [Bdellovibrionota bacterium]|jgi:peptide/nickel transport system substrate-binding protein/microcin C transport system substrate-binding protein|nr:ABC transporter substrate-binding protein [Bdellovibrionota bacterium]